MSFFLQFQSGIIDLKPGEDNDATSRKIAELLVNEPWVQLRARRGEDQVLRYTQWTVLERDEHGIPSKIMCQQYDGSLTLLNNGE